MKHLASAGDTAVQSSGLEGNKVLISSTAKTQTFKNTQITNEGWDEWKPDTAAGLLSQFLWHW